ncbi:hypothetical protein GCM10023152_26030 [Agromyces bauzanensis]|uniref:Uncharacterized protein n=1 Tax=Agromyces bauzanensis TaxID=1308924 RepID=A0A917UWC5_9MICO|nr:hypothetical protein GCM10011372_30820 [Agromyces bauzanensis]
MFTQIVRKQKYFHLPPKPSREIGPGINEVTLRKLEVCRQVGIWHQNTVLGSVLLNTRALEKRADVWRHADLTLQESLCTTLRVHIASMQFDPAVKSSQ